MKSTRETEPSRIRHQDLPVDTDAPAVRSQPRMSPARPRQYRRWLAVAAVLVATGLVVLLVRDKGKAAGPVLVPEVALEGAHIRFTESFANRHHIETVKVAESELTPVLSATGTVRYDPRRFSAVGARSTGRIRRVYKIAGDTVKPGDVLADIESSDLGRAQANAEALRAKEGVALSNLRREEQLAAARVTAAREAELAKADHDSLRAERRAAEKAVAALGAGVASEVGVLKLRSPIAGKVLIARAAQGQTIEPSDTLFEVADLSTVWVELVVFEHDLDRVHAGDEVEIPGPAGKSEAVKGTVAHISDVVDPVSRSALARVEVDNRDGVLRPGQSTMARIRSQHASLRSVTVPKAAITFVDGKPTAFLLVSPGLVEPHAVDLGPDDGQHVSIRQGLRAGDSIIGNGLFALKSELFR